MCAQILVACVPKFSKVSILTICNEKKLLRVSSCEKKILLARVPKFSKVSILTICIHCVFTMCVCMCCIITMCVCMCCIIYIHTPTLHTPTPTPTPTPTYKKIPCRAASQNFTQDTSSTTEGCRLYVTRDSIFSPKWYIYGGADFSDFSECISGPVLHHSSVSHLCTRKVNILGR